MKKQHQPRLLALPLVLAACTHIEGSSSSPAGEDPGEYSVAAFGYEDPYAETFHPLTTPEFTALRRDEVAVVVGSSQGAPFSGATWVRDDASEDFSIEGLPGGLLGVSPFDSATGQFDEDPWPEMAFVGRVSKSFWQVSLVDRTELGGVRGVGRLRHLAGRRELRRDPHRRGRPRRGRGATS